MDGKMLIGAAAALLLTGVSTADAGARKHKHHKRVYAPVAAYVPASPYAYPGPRPVWAAPQQCFTDEGYGRYWPCGAGSNRR